MKPVKKLPGLIRLEKEVRAERRAESGERWAEVIKRGEMEGKID